MRNSTHTLPHALISIMLMLIVIGALFFGCASPAAFPNTTPDATAAPVVESVVEGARAIEWVDPVFEKLIRQYLDKPTDDVLESDLADIRYLELLGDKFVFVNETDEEGGFPAVQDKISSLTKTSFTMEGNQYFTGGISSIADVANFPNLEWFFVWYNPISDLTPLKNLKGLTAVGVQGGEVSDISALAELVELEHLDLTYNHISDISPIANLKNLRVAGLGGNEIKNFPSLAGLTSLKRLHLAENPLEDFAPLVDLPQLTELSLNTCKIDDLSKLPLSGMQLEYLNLTSNAIKDVSALSEMTSLEDLRLTRNEISDLTSLGKLSNLKKLYLGGNKLQKISALSNLSSLEVLYLWGNDLTDISPLAGLASLKELHLSQNKIEDLTPLKGLTNLTYLNLATNGKVTSYAKFVEVTQGQKVRDIAPYNYFRHGFLYKMNLAPLAELINLEELVLDDNVLDELAPLLNLTKLKSFSASECFIWNILNVFTQMPELKHLDLSKNGITLISDLSKNVALETLDLSENSVDDIRALTGLSNLRDLVLTDNPISDISPLADLTNIRNLNLQGDEVIEDCSPLAKLTNLVLLAIDSTNVETIPELPSLEILMVTPITEGAGIEGMKDFPKLGFLALNKFDCGDLSALTKIDTLETLFISRTKRIDLASIAKINSLRNLEFYSCAINDISEVRNMKNLKTLTIEENSGTITDWTPADHVPIVNKGK